MAKEKESLIKLLLDIDSPAFREIERRANAVNIFEVLNLARTEIRHSNMLGWLLDPNENHHLGSAFSKYFLYEIFNDQNLENETFDFGKLFLQSVDNFIVYRERFNIDILLVANEQLICIENKIDSFEHSEQLTKYETILNKQFPQHEKLFLYLTPNGEDISKYPKWHEISYQTVIKALHQVLTDRQLEPNAEILIKDYLKILEEKIMKGQNENEIEKLCLDIYKKHKTALDLIFEYRPDDDLAISEAIINHLQNRHDVIYDGFNSGKNLIRFTTQTMKDLFPNATPNKKSPWANGYAFMYEIYLWNGKLSAVFSHPIYQDKDQQNAFEQKFMTVYDHTQKHNQTFGVQRKNKSLRPDWQWYTAYNYQIVDRNNYNGTLEELIDAMKTRLDHFIEHDLKDFENKIKTTLATAK